MPFETNRLESPVLVVSEVCVDFWYHMHGSEDLNELKVVILAEAEEWEVWGRKGNQSSAWLHGSIAWRFGKERRIQVRPTGELCVARCGVCVCALRLHWGQGRGTRGALRLHRCHTLPRRQQAPPVLRAGGPQTRSAGLPASFKGAVQTRGPSLTQALLMEPEVPLPGWRKPCKEQGEGNRGGSHCLWQAGGWRSRAGQGAP